MSKFEIKMPKLGESITEGTILSWSVRVGDTVHEDDVLFEVNSAKVSAEIPSPVAGKVAEIRFKEGETVAVGTVVALVEMDGESSGDAPAGDVKEAAPATPAPQQAAPAAPAPQQATPAAAPVVETPAPAAAANTAPVAATPAPETAPAPRSADLKAAKSEGERWYSPVVLQLAREAGIQQEELETVQGTGFEGRLSKKDIRDYIMQKRTAPAPAQPTTAPQQAPAAATAAPAQPAAAPAPAKPAAAQPQQAASDASVEVKEMDFVRKLIADHMVLSKQTSPHVTTVVEADVTRLVKWREKTKDEFFRREGIKLTFMPAITQAVAKALVAWPQVNVSVDKYNILYKKHINISIAVSLDNGNLITPVVHDADRLSLSGLALAIDSQAAKARSNKLKTEDIDGGTFTITNFGSFKSLFGTPIINQPQVAILGVGVVEKKPAVIETPEGDTIAIRHKMYLSLSYDHRVIDGSLGGQFLYAIKEYLENWSE